MKKTSPYRPHYGTQARLPERDPGLDFTPTPKTCVRCGQVRPGEWYEFRDDGWVCDTCNDKPKPKERAKA